MTRIGTMFLVVLPAVLGGCSTDYYQRNEGVSGYGGNAVASNTVLQMVDPWPRGVEDTELKTAAKRLGEERAPAEEPVYETETKE